MEDYAANEAPTNIYFILFSLKYCSIT